MIHKHTDTAAIFAVATLIGVAFAGSTVITPLYVLYEDAFGFSKLTLTLVYAVYVVGNLTALLFFGRLSDQIGRRTTTPSGCRPHRRRKPASTSAWKSRTRPRRGRRAE